MSFGKPSYGFRRGGVDVGEGVGAGEGGVGAAHCGGFDSSGRFWVRREARDFGGCVGGY